MNEQYKRTKTNYEHRDVWERIHGKIPSGYVIHHKNGDKTDNRIENLMLVTRSEHMMIHACIKAGIEWNGGKTTAEELKRRRREYYRAHREEIRKRQKEYNARNREKNLERVKKWRLANAEKRKAWIEKNRELLREKARIRYRNNKLKKGESNADKQ